MPRLVSGVGVCKSLLGGTSPKLPPFRAVVVHGSQAIDNFINSYEADGGIAVCVNEGCLTSGDWVLTPGEGGQGSFVIKEVVLNEWSSAQTIRRYRKLPEKYKKMIDRHAAP